MTRGAGVNGFASLVKQRASAKTKRRVLDDYETPPPNTRALLRHVTLRGPVLEPAAGSGRMAAVLRDAGLRVVEGDIKRGPQHDFPARWARKVWPGDIVTNPPYRDGLADAFARTALAAADGRVALLVEARFLWGDGRAAALYALSPPELVIVCPARIYFFADDAPIPSQFFNHCWVVWPERAARAWNRASTRLCWDSGDSPRGLAWSAPAR